MITKETILKFFKGQCNTEETVAVKSYFDANPEAVNEYLSEEEWNAFEPKAILPGKISDKLWYEVKKQSKEKQATIYYFRKIAIAASIILVLGIGWILHYNSKKVKILPPVAAISNGLKTIMNNTDTNMHIHLSDGSLVELLPQSILTYPDTFLSAKRNIRLTGEAIFSVAKDKAKPFTVYSENLSTTALGTKFLVKAYKKDNTIIIKLMEGKIVIKQFVNTLKRITLKDFYLIPGETFVYDKLGMTGTVLKNNIAITANKIKSDEQNSEMGNKILEGNNWYMFNKEPLSRVLNQLQILYNVKIKYSISDIKGLTFIGKIDSSDSIEDILKSIAQLNQLKIIKRDTLYILQK